MGAIAVSGAMCLLSVPATARADPFVITAGALTFRSNNSAGVDLTGPGFALGFADTNPEEFGLPGLAIEHADPFAAAFPVSGHILVDLSATLNRGGELLMGSVLLDLLFDGGEGNAARTSCEGDGCIRISAFAPFRMTGTLHARGGPNQVVDGPIVGGGTAEVGSVLRPGETPTAFAAYRFEPAAATPEPATLLLLASGAVALAWRSRRSVRSAAR
jgi:hypothetical protein